MTFEYEFKREDLKKVLVKKRTISTICILILGIGLYFYLTMFGILNEYFDTFKLLLGFLIYFVILYVVLYLINIWYINRKLKANDRRTNNAYGKYIIKMNDKQIESDFNEQKIVYKWDDISKLKIRKNYFFIRTKNDFIGLTFRRSMLKDDYSKILNYIKEKTTK